MLLQHFLEKSTRRYPDKCAVACRGARYTYRDINDSADKLACALRSAGIERGDRVAIFLENCVEAVVSIFGILKADAVFVMLSASMKQEKLSYILGHCAIKAIISDSSRIVMNTAVLNASRYLRFVVSTGNTGKDNNELKIPVEHWNDTQNVSPQNKLPINDNIDRDLAAIIYTSGSTADPKGVMLTHLNMVSAAHSITQYLESRPDDIVLNVLPLSFDYGLYQIIMAFKMGATVVLEKSFTYPYQAIKTMVENRVTGFPGVPTIFSILLQMSDIGKHDLGSLRYITNTAAALPVEHVRKLQDFFPHARIYSMYGLTECKRVSYLPPEELRNRPGSVGKAMPNEEVWIVDEAGSRLAPGMTGELVVRGSNVMLGYWGDEAATNAVLRPGPLPGERVLYTGDLFRMDKDGYLYFVGRKDDMIKTRGERVSPREIENALCGLNGVAEAAVIPVPDAVLGSAIKAFVVPQKDRALQEREIILHCRSVLEDFAVPRFIEIRDSLPKNESGKIDKLVLRGSCHETMR